jgi:Spy/CpxP family protein refolding chaperone
MKVNKVLVVVLFLTIFLADTVAVEAGRFGRHHGFQGMMGPGFHGLKTLIQLDLSDSQKSEIMSILEKYDNETANLKESLKETRKNLARVLHTDQADENQIRSTLRQAAPIKEELFVMRVKMVVELKKVLTPEQLQVLNQGKAHRIDRWKTRNGPVPKDTSK